MEKFEFEAIAVARSDYQQKFAIPRQPNLAPAAQAQLIVNPELVAQGALDGIEHASHLWVLFVFHAVAGGKSAKVRPPRLGGNKKIGVFATRSTHRPNPIGQSVVRLLDVEKNVIHIGGADLLDGTPVLDIKPYLPWCDSVDCASSVLAPNAPFFLDVNFSDAARKALAQFDADESERIEALLRQSLGQDPRPSYHQHDPERVYGVRMVGCDIRWCHQQDKSILVLAIQPE